MNSTKVLSGDEHFVSDDSNRFGPVIYLFPPSELYDLNSFVFEDICRSHRIKAGHSYMAIAQIWTSKETQ